MRLELLLAASMGLLLSCSSSSPTDCDLIDAGTSVAITVLADDGTAICDAYATAVAVELQTCSNSGCLITCTSDRVDGPLDLTLTVSRRGYEPVSARQTLPVADACNLKPRPIQVVLHKTADAGGCVARDTAKCSDHRTCYDGATATGCTATTETSSDPGASYVCCQ